MSQQLNHQNENQLCGPSGDKYYLSEEQIKQYERDGYLHLTDVASQETLLSLDEAFNNLTLNEENIKKLGKDVGDINGEIGKTIKDNAGISIMLPRQYWPNLDVKILESRCAHISEQLFGKNMLFDFDRFVAKKPNRNDAVFHWHQDQLYCQSHGDVIFEEKGGKVKDSRAGIFSVALDDTTKENGCIQYVVGSHKEPELRKHIEIEHDNNNYEIVNKVTKTIVDEKIDNIIAVPIKRGDLTIHGPRIVHGSSGNNSNGWRRSYMIQFRSEEQVQQRIALGISRSFNVM